MDANTKHASGHVEPHTIFWEQLRNSFEQSTNTQSLDSDDMQNTAQPLHLQALLDKAVVSSFGENEFNSECIKKAVEEFHASADKATGEDPTWKDVERVVAHLDLGKLTMNSRISIASSGATLEPTTDVDETLLKSIGERLEHRQFPPVRPDELKVSDERGAAHVILALLKKESIAEFVEYLEVCHQDVMETEKNVYKNKSHWIYANLYTCLLKFIWMEALRRRHFPHHHHEDNFLPVVPIQSIHREKERTDALRIVAQIDHKVLPAIDSALWKDWEDLEEMLELTGEPPETAFESFLWRDYFPIMERVFLEEQKITVNFTPLILANKFADADTVKKRKACLCLAIPEDGEQATKGMKIDFERFLSTQGPRKQEILKRLPLEETKMGADLYYKHLDMCVRARKTGGVTPQPSPAQEKDNATVDVANTNIFSIQNLIAGESIQEQIAEVPQQVCEYVSSQDCLLVVADNTLVNYQGVLFYCDSEARQVEIGQIYTQKKKQKATVSGHVANMILVDQTGPILVTVWNDLAEKMTEAWNSLQNSRTSNSEGPANHIVDFQRIRVYSLPKTDWNGEALTKIRYLRNVESPGATGNETKFTMLAQPTAFNLLKIKWTLPPPHCCVVNFQTLKNKLRAPCRLTVRGTVSGVKPIEITQSGNRKECVFFSSSNFN